jgi:hypothetical protein
MSDQTSYSRSPDPSPFGKCEKRLDVPAPELLEQVCIALGSMSMPRPMPKAEYIRNHLERTLLGLWTCFRAKTHQLKADPLDPPDVSLEDALTALAAIAGVSVEVYKRSILERVVFGEFCMVRSLAERAEQGNVTNIGLRDAA